MQVLIKVAMIPGGPMEVAYHLLLSPFTQPVGA